MTITTSCVLPVRTAMKIMTVYAELKVSISNFLDFNLNSFNFTTMDQRNKTGIGTQ